jgi:hypothetical protein
VTVTYFDGPVLATDEPLHNGEASIGYPASSFHGAPVSQPCDVHDRAALCRQAFPQRVGSRRGRADHGRGIAMMRGLIYDTPLDLELIRSRAAREKHRWQERGALGRRRRRGPLLAAAL